MSNVIENKLFLSTLCHQSRFEERSFSTDEYLSEAFGGAKATKIARIDAKITYEKIRNFFVFMYDDWSECV